MNQEYKCKFCGAEMAWSQNKQKYYCSARCWLNKGQGNTQQTTQQTGYGPQNQSPPPAQNSDDRFKPYEYKCSLNEYWQGHRGKDIRWQVACKEATKAYVEDKRISTKEIGSWGPGDLKEIRGRAMMLYTVLDNPPFLRTNEPMGQSVNPPQTGQAGQVPPNNQPPPERDSYVGDLPF